MCGVKCVLECKESENKMLALSLGRRRKQIRINALGKTSRLIRMATTPFTHVLARQIDSVHARRESQAALKWPIESVADNNKYAVHALKRLLSPKGLSHYIYIPSSAKVLSIIM